MQKNKLTTVSQLLIKSLVVAVLIIQFSCSEFTSSKEPVKPDGFFDYEAFEHDEKQKEYKRIYKEQLYHAAPGTNVDSIRNQHLLEHLRKSKGRRAKGVETFANGAIMGEWFERGPTNEAGDLREVDYDPQNDSLYVMTTAGSIFKGNVDGKKWRLINDQIKFNTDVLNQVKKNGVERLIAIYGSGKDNKIPRYSDDMGQTWNKASGIGDGFHDGWGSPKKMIELDGGKILYYMVHTWKSNPWGAAIEVYKSIDWGESYTSVLSMNGGGYDKDEADMWKPVDADNIYVLDNEKKQFYSITTNLSNGSHTLSTPTTVNGLGNGKVKLTGRYDNGNPVFYALISGNTVYKSNNSDGSSWTNRSQVSIDGEAQGIFRNVFMANPLNNQLYMGGFQFYKTSDEVSWTQQYPQWWAYYNKTTPLPQRKDYMHVDMMEMEFFRKADNTPFFIILNHAGIYASYDNMATTINLGQEGLNVVTLYDHATAPDGTIFFGAQDKGTFRNTGDNNITTSLFQTDNQTTGDGMRELFFNNGNSWFGFLQNGSMICMPDKKGSNQQWWQVPGDHIPGWINPVENHPDPTAKSCYVAGGNINGGAGSYLIKMDVSWTGTNSNFQWQPSQYNYDFRANSRNGRSVIKALSASQADYDRLYVATNDGTFFYSNNGGTSWTRSSYNIPTSLVPWDMVVSKTDADKVFMCGTGWSNDGVYQSTDGGVSFTGLSTDAPLATYFDLVLSSEEDILYAATSEGPYAYVFADNRWYDISGNNAPYVDYRSVEYIASIKTIRFGTYGRGVWDFVLKEEPIADCNGTPEGTAFLDYCDKCVGGTTEKVACQVPYTNLVIPGTIEAEAYDYGGQDISYYDATEDNLGAEFRTESVDLGAIDSGGYYLGWTATGEWLEYTVTIEETAQYDIDYIIASVNSNGKFHLEIDDQPITDVITVNTTGGWQIWQTKQLQGIDLTAGEHLLKVFIDYEGLNLDKLVFKKSTITSLTITDFEKQVSIYPNPATGKHISLKVPAASTLRVLDDKGRLVHKSLVNAEKLLNISNWSAGTYLLELVYDGKKVVKKVVVE